MEPDRPDAHHRGERGETLLESIIAIAILSLVAITAAVGLATTTKANADQRLSARGETLLRSAAEQLQNPDMAYIPRSGCSGSPDYHPGADRQRARVHGHRPVRVVLAGVRQSARRPSSAYFAPTCPPNDAADLGVQEVVLEVVDPRGESDLLTVMKRRA